MIITTHNKQERIPNLNFRFYIFTLLLFLLTLNLNSQNNFEFEQLKGENVTTQSITYGIEQDSIGNLWIASEEGVMRYNSNIIKVYNSYNGLPEAVTNRSTALLVDSKERVWVGHENGIVLYDANFDKFNIVESSIDINPSLINDIIEAEDGTIWASGYNGLWRYNAENSTFERKVENYIVQAIFSKNNYVIFGTLSHLYCYNKKTDVVIEIKGEVLINEVSFVGEANNFLLAGTKSGDIYTINKENWTYDEIILKNTITHPIKDIVSDRFSNVYIAVDGEGLYYYSKENKLISHYFEDVDNPYSLTSNGLYDIELGKENILWIATYGGGVNYYDFNKSPFKKIKHEINRKNTIATNFSRSITNDENGNIWFGTTKGISIWDPETDIWRQLPKLTTDKNNETDIVLSLESDGNNIWAGTFTNGLFRIDVNTLKSTQYSRSRNKKIDVEKVFDVFKDSKGNIWFSGVNGSLDVRRPNDAIDIYPIFQIKAIAETRKGEIIVGGKNGVYAINDTNTEFKLLEKIQPNERDLAYSTIHAIEQSENGNLIFATNGAGLLIYNQEKNSLNRISMETGLPSDIVQGLIIENSTTLWASTAKGLAKITLRENDTIINVLDKQDGLATTEFNYGSYAKLNDSLYAFGGPDGVTLFNPKKIQSNNLRPILEFEEFKLFNRSIDPGVSPLPKHINKVKKITLKSNENSIEFKFAGVLHSSSSKMKYTWILQGFEETWSTPNYNNIATYTNLNPGDYTFKVKASNKYGDFGSVRQIKVNVKSPWWATSKAYVLYFVLVLGAIGLMIHFTSVVINKKNADEQIHFFNNITHEIKTPLTILMSSLDSVTENTQESGSESNKRIKTTVKRLNSLFEQLLNFHKVTSENDIDHDVSKIELESHIKHILNDFKPLTEEHKLKINIENQWRDELFYYDQEILDKIIFNLVSNAIKYSFDGNKIDIKLIKTKKGSLKIEISDYGLGIPKDQQKYILNRYYRARNVINSQRPGTGLGLVMVKRLLEKTGGSISFQSAENRGTTFTVVLRNQKEEYKESALHKHEFEDKLKAEIDDQAELDQFSDSKILIVEDNDELRDILVNTLGVHFQIYEAKNGNEGLEFASQIYPDLILTDLIMPEMDGLTMCKHLKADINLNHIPVFMLTVLRNSKQKIESIESGVSEYIEKPVDIKFLLAKISHTLKWQKKLQKKFVQQSDVDSASVFRNKNDQEFLTNLEKTVLDNIENNTFSVHDLSRSFGMSRTSLYMKLKNLVDLSPQDFIIHTKLKHAKKLLIQGDLSIKEVAYNSGFSNPKYFSTSFKKFYGMTPSGFLESLQNKES